jgi:hypothetical protein
MMVQMAFARFWVLIADGSVSVLEKGGKEERKILPD